MRHTPTWLFSVAALALGYAVHLGGGGPHALSFVLLAVSLVATGMGVASWPRRLAPTTVEQLLMFGLAAQFALLLAFPIDTYLPGVAGGARLLYIGGVLAAMAGGIWLMRRSTMTWLGFSVVLSIHFLLGVWLLSHSANPFIDVWQFQQTGVDALLRGTNPYLPIYHDLYNGDPRYLGPGIVEDGRLTVGLPYPPLSLLMALPGKVLTGDHRFAQLVAVELAALGMVLIRPGRLAAGAALCFLFMPRTLLVVERGWTEPFGVLLLTLVVLAAVRAPRVAGLAVGLLIAVKQYLLLGLPLALLLVRRGRDAGRLIRTAVLAAVVITVPFALWDPTAFFNSTVRFLAVQPFRPDSLTFLALLPVNSATLGSAVAFALLIPAAALIAWRAPRNPAGYAAALAFLLLVFFASGKQGAINYYFMVIGALYVAIAARAEVSLHGGVEQDRLNS